MADNPHKKWINSIGIWNELIRTIRRMLVPPNVSGYILKELWNQSIWFKFSEKILSIFTCIKWLKSPTLRWNISEDILFQSSFEYLFLVSASRRQHIYVYAIVINRFVNFRNMHAKRICFKRMEISSEKSDGVVSANSI